MIDDALILASDAPVPCELVDVESGRILQWISPVYSQLQQQSPIGSGTFIAYGQHDQQRFYYPEGVLRERPRVSADDTFQLRAGEALSLVVPGGSFISYLYPSKGHRSGFLATSHTIETDDTLTFRTDLAGEHRLIVRPPFPWCRQELRLLVQ